MDVVNALLPGHHLSNCVLHNSPLPKILHKTPIEKPVHLFYNEAN